MRAAKGRCLIVLALAAGCAEPAGAPRGVPSGSLRVAPLDDVAARLGWARDWLAADGWTFSGFSFEAGSAGRVGIRWCDPRQPNAVFADLEWEMAPAEPVRVVIGVRLRPELLGPIAWTCESCGSSYKLQGSILGTSTECPRCKTPHDLAPEWTEAPSRDFRLVLVGDARNVKASERLRRSGETFRMGSARVALFAAKLPRRSAMDPEKAFVVQGLRGHRRTEFAGGTHRLVRLLDPGETDRRSGGYMDDDFEARSDRVTVRGTKSTFEIFVDGAPVQLADYPFAAWDLDLTWTPKDAPPPPPKPARGG